MNKGIVDRATFLVWGVQNIDSFGFDSYVEIKNNASDIIEKMIDGISVFNDELVSPEELEKYVVKKLSVVPLLVSTSNDSKCSINCKKSGMVASDFIFSKSYALSSMSLRMER